MAHGRNVSTFVVLSNLLVNLLDYLFILFRSPILDLLQLSDSRVIRQLLDLDLCNVNLRILDGICYL